MVDSSKEYHMVAILFIMGTIMGISIFVLFLEYSALSSTVMVGDCMHPSGLALYNSNIA